MRTSFCSTKLPAISGPPLPTRWALHVCGGAARRLYRYHHGRQLQDLAAIGYPDESRATSARFPIFRLSLGTSTETVEVHAEAAEMLTTDSGERSALLSSKDIETAFAGRPQCLGVAQSASGRDQCSQRNRERPPISISQPRPLPEARLGLGFHPAARPIAEERRTCWTAPTSSIRGATAGPSRS